MGVAEDWHRQIAAAALQASSMKGNPVPLDLPALHRVLAAA